MSTLAKFGLHDWPGDKNVYDWLLLKINSNNYGAEIVTYGLVSDLKGFLQLKRNQHDAENPPNKLSRQQLCHLVIYLVTRISSENVTKNFENGLFKQLTAKDKENRMKCGILGSNTSRSSHWGLLVHQKGRVMLVMV